MDDQEHKTLTDLLRRSFTPAERELHRDLWPQMLQRFGDRSGRRQWLAVLFSPAAFSSVPWFDWVLLAALVAGVCISPKSIPIWLYHF